MQGGRHLSQIYLTVCLLAGGEGGIETETFVLGLRICGL